MKIEKYTKESLLFSILRAAENTKKKINTALKNEDINFYQALILSSIYLEQKNNLEPTDFVCVLGISKAVVSQSITKLEELKLVKRTVNPTDARRTFIGLTARGEKKATTLMAILHKSDKEVELPFKKSEIKSLVQFLEHF